MRRFCILIAILLLLWGCGESKPPQRPLPLPEVMGEVREFEAYYGERNWDMDCTIIVDGFAHEITETGDVGDVFIVVGEDPQVSTWNTGLWERVYSRGDVGTARFFWEKSSRAVYVAPSYNGTEVYVAWEFHND